MPDWNESENLRSGIICLPGLPVKRVRGPLKSSTVSRPLIHGKIREPSILVSINCRMAFLIADVR